MKTLKVDLKNKGIEERNDCYKKAKEILLSKGTVIFPTETVYGLGALATDEEAVEKIFLAKGRPSDNPLIVHVGSKNIEKYVSDIPEIGKKLMERFWPGPLTIIFNKSDFIPEKTSAGLKTVGIRMPKNKVALEMLSYIDIPVAAPSANISGKPSPTTYERCIEDMDSRVDMIIGYDMSEIGLESTIVDVTVSPIEILRPGAITLEDLKVIEKDVIFRGNKSLSEGEAPRAPGMKYKHYAPKAEVTILRISERNYDKLIEIVGNKAILIYFGELEDIKAFIEKNKKNILGKVINFPNEEAGSKEIFEIFRKADDEGIDNIYIIETKEDGIGLALMNRVTKASAFKTIDI